MQLSDRSSFMAGGLGSLNRSRSLASGGMGWVAWYGLVVWGGWYGMVWYVAVWYNAVWYGTIW